MNGVYTVYKRTIGRREKKCETYYAGDGAGGGFEHPWFTTVGGDDGGYSVTVKPGFVNGIDPVYMRAKVDDDGNTTEEAVSLLDSPSIPIPAGAIEDVPNPNAFFRRLGAAPPPAIEVSAGGGVSIDATQREGEGDKSLRKVDVFLAQTRPTYKIQTNIIGNILMGQLVDWAVVFDTQAMDALGTRPIIRVGKMPEQGRPTLTIGIDLDTSDAGIDYLLIATIYFLAGEEGTEMYVQHNVFWNLFYGSRQQRPIEVPGLQLDPALAVLVGRFTPAAGALFAVQDALFQQVWTTALNSNRNEGRFWTA
jgi:hypothetical protein